MAKQGYEHMSTSDMSTSDMEIGQEYGFAARVEQAGGSWSTPPTDEFEERFQGSQHATVVPGYPVIMPTAPAAPVGLVVQDPLHMGRREWKQARRERKRARRMSKRRAGPVQALFGLVRNAILSAQEPLPHLQNHQNHLQGHPSYQNPQDHQSYQSYQNPQDHQNYQSYQNHLPRPGYQ